jgi:hypothetical protein
MNNQYSVDWVGVVIFGALGIFCLLIMAAMVA